MSEEKKIIINPNVLNPITITNQEIDSKELIEKLEKVCYDDVTYSLTTIEV